jgi:hypothetical protein
MTMAPLTKRGFQGGKAPLRPHDGCLGAIGPEGFQGGDAPLHPTDARGHWRVRKLLRSSSE